jgi:multiple sugar transport system permease protein
MATLDQEISLSAGSRSIPEKRKSKYPSGLRVFIVIALILGSALMILPFIWLVSSSLKPELAVFTYPPKLIPNPVMWQNYIEAWTAKPFHIYLKNTLILVIINEIAVLSSASICAYGFARIDFDGKKFWFTVLLSTMMLPGIVTMVPTFVIFSRLHWVNTFLPLTVPAFFGGGAFNIFLLRQFFLTLPEELADAARIDGADEFKIFSQIMIPLATPALATIAVFTFIGVWNDFMGPLLYLARNVENYTVALGLATFRQAFAGRTRWDLIMAASTMMVAPVVVIFFFAQKTFIQGIALTGLKG